MNLLQAADYLNAQLLVRALAWEVSKKPITKKHLKSFPDDDIMYQIIIQYILRTNFFNPTIIVNLFDQQIITDLKKKKSTDKKYKNLYNQIVDYIRDKKIHLPYYDKKKIGLSEAFDISKDIKIHYNKLLISISEKNKTVKIWNIKTGECIDTLKGLRSVAFNPKNNIRAYGYSDGKIILWDSTKKESIKTFKAHEASVTLVAFSPDGKILASTPLGRFTGHIKLWDAKTGESIKNLKVSVNQFTFSPDSKILAVKILNSKQILLYDISTPKKTYYISSVYNIEGNYDSMAFSPNGEILALGFDGKAELWDVSNLKETKLIKTFSQVTVPKNNIKPVVFSPDGKKLAICNIALEEETYGGTTLNKNDFPGKMELFNIEDPKKAKKIKTIKGKGKITSVACNLNNNTLAFGFKDGKIELWDIKTEKKLKTLKGHDNEVTSIKFEGKLFEEIIKTREKP